TADFLFFLGWVKDENICRNLENASVMHGAECPRRLLPACWASARALWAVMNVGKIVPMLMLS
ncbi:hypothetical protein, partial [Desulfovibrio sp. SGI.230]|uniref:hypothetical protein n=1 Tax=Desulfovibrio sp. SGI.230 TaxID=3420562 RepID=UPI003D016282